MTLRNTSARDSREVVQVYLSPADPTSRSGWSAGPRRTCRPAGRRQVPETADPRWRRWTGPAGWQPVGGGELLVARGLGDVRVRLPLA